MSTDTDSQASRANADREIAEGDEATGGGSPVNDTEARYGENESPA
jgi:hypothetical protein